MGLLFFTVKERIAVCISVRSAVYLFADARVGVISHNFVKDASHMSI